MQACRKKGRVVLVGDVGLHLQRSDMYEKELDFLISTSYGPGRYDDVYELEGQDYPIGYVRWTENRNMEEYLRLLAEGRVSLDGLGQETFPVDDAETAYEALKSSETKPLLVLLSYPEREEAAHADDAAADARAEAGEDRRRARRRRQLRAGPAPAEPDQAARPLRAARGDEPHGRDREGGRRARRGRLRDDRPRRGARRRGDRPRPHLDPARLARRPGAARARGGQERLRREAAGARTRTSSPRSRRSTPAARTGRC